MVILLLFRLVTNAVLGFLFIYIDIVSRENTGIDRGDIVLVSLAIYGTFFIFIKSIFAVYNHVKWMFCGRCCQNMPNDRNTRMYAIDAYWKKEYVEWNTEFSKKTLVGGPSFIEKRKR